MSVFFYLTGDTFSCPVCLGPWEDPVELKPCGHIGCARCLGPPAPQCFVCGSRVLSAVPPNRALLNMLDSAAGHCSGCSWSGDLRQFPAHVAAVTHSGNVMDVFSLAISLQQRRGKQPLLNSPTPLAAPETPPTFVSQGGGAVVRTSNTTQAPDSSINSPTTYLEQVFTQQIFPRAWSMFTAASNGTSIERTRVLRLTRYLNLCTDYLAVLGGDFVTQAQYLQWARSGQRNPSEQYNMTPQTYVELLGQCHRIDTQCTGILSVSQCRQIAEYFIKRQVTSSEWSKVHSSLETYRSRAAIPDVPRDKYTYHHLFTAIGVHLKPPAPAVAPQETSKRGESLLDTIKRKVLGDEKAQQRISPSNQTSSGTIPAGQPGEISTSSNENR